MGILSRTWELLQAKTNKLLDRMEDPNASLDLSYEKMLDGLQELKVNLADVVTEQKRIEGKIAKCDESIAKRDEEAAAAVKLGKDDLARSALSLKQTDLAQKAAFEKSLEGINRQVEAIKKSEAKFKERIATFKSQKEVTKANYTAAKAQADVEESLSGVSNKFGGVGRTLKNAEDKTEQLQARADAVSQLSAEGVLNDPLDPRDSVSKELDDVRQESAVEDELAALKSKIEK